MIYASEVSILAIVRCGRSSIHRAWSTLCGDLIDVVVSNYNLPYSDAADHYFQGRKLQGIFDFFTSDPGLINRYTHFWLLEDDLYICRETVMQVRSMLETFSFALCAPALTPDSYFSWPITLHNSEFAFRVTNFVEQMAPVLSRAFLIRTLPYFRETISGWGIEWIWHRLLAEMSEIAAIIDSAPVTHTRPVGSGSLYANVDFKEEMRLFFLRNRLQPRVPFINYFGIDARGNILEGQSFRNTGSAGYRSVKKLNMNANAHCLCLAKINELMPFDENNGTKRVRMCVA